MQNRYSNKSSLSQAHSNMNSYSKHSFFSVMKKSFIFLPIIICLILTTIFLVFHLSNQCTIIIQVRTKSSVKATCDLFKGRWIHDARGPLYTNHSCKTIPINKNCLLNERKDAGFLHWRWKPDQCELPRFNPQEFLASMRGKTMAFIGDSLARNQMESLLCLLSTVQTPNQMVGKGKDKFTTWEFPKQNFTLMVLWSQFLVSSTERVVNGSKTGSFDIHLDQVDPAWSERLPAIDYAIFSDGHWFFRENYLYEGGKVVGCTSCQSADIPSIDASMVIGKVFRTAFRAVNDCRSCGRIFSLLRTYSPSHFEYGMCNKTGPTGEAVDRGGGDWRYRTVQVEELERARSVGEKSFEVIDTTRMMSVRKDGHPGEHWTVNWMKGSYRDCLHWCLPGPIDVWNELLFEVIKRKMRVLSQM